MPTAHDTPTADQRREATPYPSWAEIMSRLRRDGSETTPPPAPDAHDWHTLVADMVAGR